MLQMAYQSPLKGHYWHEECYSQWHCIVIRLEGFLRLDLGDVG